MELHSECENLFQTSDLKLDPKKQSRADHSKMMPTSDHLNESERRYAEALAIARVGNWSWIPETGQATWSAENYRLFGFEPTVTPSEELFRSIVHPDDQKLIQQQLGELFAGVKDHYEGDYRIVRRDGQVLWLSGRGRAIRDASGRILRIEGTNQDITERRQAEDLRQVHSEVLLSMSEAVCFMDSSGAIQVTNAAFDSMFGYEPGELIGKHPAMLIDATANEIESFGTMLQDEMKRTGKWTGECRNLKKDGTVFFTRPRITIIPKASGIQWICVLEDITEWKRIEADRVQLTAQLKAMAEEATRSRAQLEAVIQSMQDGVYVFDTAGNAVLINQTAVRNNGFKSAEELHQNLAFFVERFEVADLAGQRLPVEQWPISRILRGETLRNLELQVWRKDINDDSIISFSGGPVYDDQGTEVLATVVTRDITEQKQVERALRLLVSDLVRLRGAAFYEEVVRRLAEFVNCEWALVCRNDVAQPDHFVTLAFLADGTLLPNFSYSAAGTPCADITDQATCVIPCGAWRKYSQDQFLIDHKIEGYVGVPFINRQGRQLGHIGVMSRQPIANAEHVERLATMFAIAVVAEMERQVSERRFSDLFEFSPDAIVITNRNGLIVEANQQVATVFGWTPAELVGQPVEVLMPANLRTGHPSLRERYLQSALPRAMGSGRDDLLGLRKDGSVFPVDISLSPMQTSEGLLVAAAVRDVTERQKVLKALQSTAEELKAANTVIEQESSQLTERVAKRTAELTLANEELVRASRFKSEFLTTMSHELRTPLNGVLGMNALLLKTPLTEKQREFVEASNTSGKALLSLINDVLDISKIEAGKIELDLHPSDLEVLAYDVTAMFSHRALEKGISLNCRLDPETCVTAICDDTRLRQILVNLLGNAMKFTTTGSVNL